MNVKVVPGPRWLSGELEKEGYALIRKILIRKLKEQENENKAK